MSSEDERKLTEAICDGATLYVSQDIYDELMKLPKGKASRLQGVEVICEPLLNPGTLLTINYKGI